jgi:hypothetical protein
MNIFHQHVYQSLALLLYVGPDQALPLLSVLGAVIGFVLMWWRRLLTLTRRVFRFFAAKQEVSTKNSK